jgi:hypothetical protein
LGVSRRFALVSVIVFSVLFGFSVLGVIVLAGSYYNVAVVFLLGEFIFALVLGIIILGRRVYNNTGDSVDDLRSVWLKTYFRVESKIVDDEDDFDQDAFDALEDVADVMDDAVDRLAVIDGEKLRMLPDDEKVKLRVLPDDEKKEKEFLPAFYG